jgi:hypothetical protein
MLTPVFLGIIHLLNVNKLHKKNIDWLKKEEDGWYTKAAHNWMVNKSVWDYDSDCNLKYFLFGNILK